MSENTELEKLKLDIVQLQAQVRSLELAVSQPLQFCSHRREKMFEYFENQCGITFNESELKEIFQVVTQQHK